VHQFHLLLSSGSIFLELLPQVPCHVAELSSLWVLMSTLT
jgi:hypothetical protein